MIKRTWTIIGVGDVAGQLQMVTKRCSVSRLPFLPLITLWANPRFQMELFLLCLHEWGAHEHPSIDELRFTGTTRQRAPVVLPCRFDFDLAIQRARSSRHSARRGSHKRESEHSNQGVLAPRDFRTGILYVTNQCALCGLTRRCSGRALARGFMGQRRPTLAPLAGRLLPSDRPFP